MQVLPHTMTMIKFDIDIGVKLVVYIINSESQPYTKVTTKFLPHPRHATKPPPPP